MKLETSGDARNVNLLDKWPGKLRAEQVLGPQKVNSWTERLLHTTRPPPHPWNLRLSNVHSPLVWEGGTQNIHLLAGGRGTEIYLHCCFLLEAVIVFYEFVAMN